MRTGGREQGEGGRREAEGVVGEGSGARRAWAREKQWCVGAEPAAGLIRLAGRQGDVSWGGSQGGREAMNRRTR